MSSENGTLLKLENLHAGYGPIEVLKGVSLEVSRGEIVTMIGCNGAGKTTTLMTIAGIVRTRAGQVIFDGKPIQNTPAHELLARGLAVVPEGRKIFPRLTVLENLQMGAFIRKGQKIAQDLDHVYALFPILKERATQMGGTLSGGEQQMLAIGRALMSRPKCLLMDEPSMGIAPLLVLKIFEAIRNLNREGMTILLVEQNARMALQLAKRGYVLDVGEIILVDDAPKLLENPRVREAYLGEA